MAEQQSYRPIASQTSAKEETLAPRRPNITIPRGSGAICGMSEIFAANPASDTRATSTPITTRLGRLGLRPWLSLSYNSSSSNGPCGFGWSLSLFFRADL